MTRVPYEPTAADIITAANQQANWDELESAIDNINVNNMADNAGLLSSHLADRYALSSVTIPLYTVNNGTVIPTPVASTVLGRTKLRVSSGRRAWVYRVEVYVHNTDTGSGGEHPEINVQVAGITLGGSVQTLNTDDNIYILANSDDIADPLIPFANNDELTISVGSSGSNAPDLEGCYVIAMIKRELHP